MAVRSYLVYFFLLIFCAEAHASLDSLRQRNRNKLSADTSALLTINRILILGNKKTREVIIQRELTLKPGDTVRVNTLEEIFARDRIKMMNTRLFNSVTFKKLDYDNGVVDILINVSERWYTFPLPILELADRNFNEWWQNYNHDPKRVNFGLKLYKYNFRGRNETILLTAKFGFTNIFSLSYRIPYLDKKQKQGLIFDINYDERKNVSYMTVENKLKFAKSEQNFKVGRSISLTYTYRNSFYHYHGITLDRSRTTITDSLLKLNPKYFGEEPVKEQVYSTLSYQYVYERRDYIAYPLNGSQLVANFRQTGLFPKDDVFKTEVSVNFSRYIHLGKKYYFSNNSMAYVSFQDNLAYANYSAMGYSRQLVRGYEIYLIEGPQFVFNKTTFKKLLFQRVMDMSSAGIEQFQKIPISVYLKTYADTGYTWNYPGYVNGQRLTDKLLFGGGFGLDLVTSHDATIRLEYSFNAEGEHGFFFHLKKEF